MNLRNVLRSRLALRIYLVGLAQFAVVATGFVMLLALEQPPDWAPRRDHRRTIAQIVARAVSDERALRLILQGAGEEIDATVSVFSADNKLIGTNAKGAIPACSPAEHGPFRPPLPHHVFDLFGKPPRPLHPPCQVEAVVFPDGRRGRVEILLPGPGGLPPPPPFGGTRVIAVVLIVVGVSSWLLARTLTKPLRRLSDAARALGQGDLKARAALSNRDELGEVSKAFDEMADRIANLLRAEKELLANVSHELRTPLARIRMALALASEAEGDAVALRESVTDITADLDELERLISDILTTARLQLETQSSSAGAPPLRREQVDVQSMLSRAAARFRSKHSSRPLDVDVAENLPPVDGDAVLLRRVIDNLLENAHKYTKEPELPIKLLARLDEKVIIEVMDQGIGIAKEDLARVFQPFYRVDKSRTRATGGLGLGLALSKQIIDAHHGTIEIQSMPNEGTCVRVTLSPGSS